MVGGNASWMQHGSGNSLGRLSSDQPRYVPAKKLTEYEQKRRTLFEDFRSRMISQAELKIELDLLCE